VTDPIAVREKLDQLSNLLDKLSRELGDVERRLTGTEDDPGVEMLYERWIDAYEVGLWEKHIHGDEKFPSEAMRLRLARQQMDAALLGQYTTLVARRKRLEKRIGSVKVVIDAQRSILSALKAELEAIG
jgi:hypothetical protein